MPQVPDLGAYNSMSCESIIFTSILLKKERAAHIADVQSSRGELRIGIIIAFKFNNHGDTI